MTRTAHGFIAVGASIPGGDQAKATPLIFLSANGTSWIGSTRPGSPGCGNGHALDITSVAAAGQLILISGDAVTTRPRRAAAVQVGVAWLSADGGATWAPVSGAATGHGAQPQVVGVAAVSHGFVLFRQATAARRPAVDVFSSPNGRAWTFRATLGAPAGFTALMASGGPDGAVLAGETGGTGQAPRNLTAFASADGRTWHQARPFGPAAAQDVSGVALAPGGAVVTTGISDAPDARQPVITVTGVNATVQQVDIAQIRGAVEPQVAVNSIAAQDSTQVAVGSANGYPAAWTSGNGGSSWTRAAGALPAVFTGPGRSG